MGIDAGEAEEDVIGADESVNKGVFNTVVIEESI